MNATTKTRSAACLLACAYLAGCASAPLQFEPIIDPKIGDAEAYPAALHECRALAQQVDRGAAAAGGAIAGALIGVAIGAMFGLRGSNLAGLAGTGALTSGLRQSEYAGMTQAQIVSRCLGNRGYAVLN